MLVRSGQDQFRLVPASVLGTYLSDIALVHGSANHLSELLHTLGRKEHPPEPPEEPPEEPRRRPQASEHRDQADMAGLELAGHRLGGAQRHQAGLLDSPAPATEVQGEAGRGGHAGTGRHQDHHAADGAAEGSGGHGMDCEEHRPPTHHRSGRARAPQALASALACAEVDGASAGEVLAPAWLRPVLLTPFVGEWLCLRVLTPHSARSPLHWFWGRLGS